MTEGETLNCITCRQPLPADSCFCTTCGIDYSDSDFRSYSVQKECQRRYDRAKVMGKFYRFLRWVQIVR